MGAEIGDATEREKRSGRLIGGAGDGASGGDVDGDGVLEEREVGGREGEPHGCSISAFHVEMINGVVFFYFCLAKCFIGINYKSKHINCILCVYIYINLQSSFSRYPN